MNEWHATLQLRKENEIRVPQFRDNGGGERGLSGRGVSGEVRVGGAFDVPSEENWQQKLKLGGETYRGKWSDQAGTTQVPWHEGKWQLEEMMIAQAGTSKSRRLTRHHPDRGLGRVLPHDGLGHALVHAGVGLLHARDRQLWHEDLLAFVSLLSPLLLLAAFPAALVAGVTAVAEGR